MSLKIKTMKKLLITLLLTLGLSQLTNAQTTLFQGGTGLSTSTVGQLLVGTSSTLRYSRLDVGSAGTVLQASSTSPFRMAWVTLASIFDSLLSSNNTWTGTNNFTATTTLDKVVAGTSAGLQFFSNGLTQVADFGAGGGSNASFYGGVNITGNLAVDTNTLYVDTTNNRVGIGTTTPTAALSVSSDAPLSGQRGTLQLASITNPNKYLYAGYSNLHDAAYIQSVDYTVNWKNLLLNPVGGNVGIGTTSPQFDLTLEGSTNVDFMMRDNAQGLNTKSFLFRNTGGNLAIGRVSDNAGTLTTYMTFLNGGNVGIGTTTPQAPLEVYSPSGNVGNMARFSSGYSSGGFVSFFDATNNTTRGYFGYGPTLFTVAAIGDTGFRSQGGFAIGTNGGTVRQYINTSGAFGLGGSITNVSTFAGASLVGNSSGNIGIGTTTPAYRADIYNTDGTVLARFKDTDSTYSGLVISGDTNGSYIGNSNIGTSIGEAIYFQNSANAMRFYTSGSEKARITSTGLFGIGTSSPGSLLSVQGNAYFGGNVAATGTLGIVGQSTLTTASATALTVSGSSYFGGNTGIWNSSGNVGIGTTTPNAILSVASTTASGTTQLFNILSSTVSAIIRVLANGAVLIGTPTQANCGSIACGLTVATTTQFTAGTVARVVGYSSAASTTINLDTTDIATTTIDRATTFVNPTGTAYDGSMFEIRAKATTTQTVYWDTNFASSTDLTNVSSVASGTTRFLFEYRQDVGKWELVGKLGSYIN